MSDCSDTNIAIVVPVLNEERYLESVIASLGGQMIDRVAEILVVDGGSTDATRKIARRLAAGDDRIRLLDNPKRLQSAAINLAARAARADVRFLIRADAHAAYPPDFVERLLDAQQLSGAESVANRLMSVGHGCFQRAVAAVSNSKFGTGGAVHRSGGQSGFVDHGHHALFDRAWFEKLGGYDESFIANEDAEFDTRLRAAGGRIWFTAFAEVAYFPRDSLGGLARQYFRYGQGRARTRRKHGERLRARQMIPPALVVLFALCLVLSAWTPWALLLPLAYLAGVAAVTGLLLVRSRDRCVIGGLVALPAMHLCWGAGFLKELAIPTRGQRLVACDASRDRGDR